MKSRFLIPATAALAIALPLATAWRAQESHTVRLALKEGQVYTIVNKNEMTMSAMGQESKVNTTSTSQVNIGAEAEGWHAFTQKFTDMKMEGDETEGVDSAAMIDTLKQMTITGKVNPRAQVKDFKTEGGDPSMSAMELGDLEQTGLFGLPLPEGPMTVGTKWSSKIDLAKMLEKSAGDQIQDAKGEGSMDFEVLEFVDLEGKRHAKVSLKSVITGTFTMASMGAESSMKTDTTGFVWIDVQSGVVSKSEADITSTVDLGMFQIDQKMKSTSTVTVK